MKTKKKCLYKKKIRGGDGELVSYNANDEKFPLLQPVEIPGIVKVPFKITKNLFNWSVDKIKNSTILNSISNSIYNSVKNSLGSVNNVLTNNEITILTTELTKNFIIFFGSMLKEVGEDIANEFLEIFFEMLLNVGTKLIIGFSNVLIKLLMSFIGEIPVAGGAVDLIVTIVTSFNDVIRAITPIIKSSIKVITSGLNIFNKTSSDIMNNPNFNNLKGNVNQFSAKVFGGMTFFSFLSNMFSKLIGTVTNLFGSYNDNLKDRLKNVTNNAFQYGKNMSDNLDQQYNPESASATASATAPATDSPAEEKEALEYFGYDNLNDVTRDDLRQKYKQLSMKYHPDKNSENKDESEEKFKELGKEYSYLMEKKKFLGGFRITRNKNKTTRNRRKSKKNRKNRKYNK